MTSIRLFLSALFLLDLSHSDASARELDIEDRIQAQEAIERTYYTHQTGATRTFEQATPRPVIEKKVRTYLAQSVALEQIWNTPVTADMLDREMQRIAAGTRMPDRLRELYAALGDDSFLVAECLARPLLVDRLTRGFFASDERFRGTSWEAWLSSVSSRFDAGQARAVAREVELPPATSRASEACPAADTWDNASLDDVPAPRNHQKAVWTGSLMLVWGGNQGPGSSLASGGRYDPATDTWTPMSTVGAPGLRYDHTTIWTGSRMIVWGGARDSQFSTLAYSSGGIYDPSTDTWSATSTTGAPSSRYQHTAVWTGSRMIVFGGRGSTFFQDGARYDPSTDSWSPISVVNAPSARAQHAAVWTGTTMIVWGGANSSGLRTTTGGRYDPATDTWAPTSVAGVPSVRSGYSATWAGGFLVIWGGFGSTTYVATGGRYDPVADTWTSTSMTGVPAARSDHTAVWTGTRVIVWGGRNSSAKFDTGASYDPVADSWTGTSTLNAAAPRSEHTAVWTGSSMIVWGGQANASFVLLLNSGGRYDPSTDSWTPTTVGSGPTPRMQHTAVWTGTKMLVWGGRDIVALGDGSAYDPAVDGWTPLASAGAPVARQTHTAVWTGDSMIVWGGQSGSVYFDSGGRYDPNADAWTATSLVGAPSARQTHTATWTGSRMIVWGGNGTAGSQNTGGVYDPATDKWSSTSLSNAPVARTRHTAVWTGHDVVVWGGTGFQGTFNTGGRYDPASDTWTATSLTGAPTARESHSAVWTGSRMFISGFGGALYDPATDTWTPVSTVGAPPTNANAMSAWLGGKVWLWGGLGGGGTDYLDTGGRYDAAIDAWTPTSLVGAPVGRWRGTAVSTGSEVIAWGGARGSTYLADGGRYAVAESIDDDGDGITGCGGDCDDTNAAVHPGALENCNGIDDDCDGVIDSGLAAPAVHPALTEGKAGTVSQLAWTAVAGATGYDVVQGSLSTLRATSGDFSSSTTACLGSDVPATGLTDPEVPAAGAGLWHVVRALSACGGDGTFDEGGVQQGGRDAGIGASANACP
jgi:N-acetylneuraminic acid mutarotase